MRTERELMRIFKALPTKRKAELIDAMRSCEPKEGLPDLLTDQELCKLLDMAQVTLRKHLRCGPPRASHPHTLDLRLLKPTQIGKKRFWNKQDVNVFLQGRRK